MLSFDAKKTAGRPFVMDAGPDVARVLRSPIYSKFAFPSGGATQYADAMLRATFPKAEGWHTLLGKPEVKPVKIAIPVGYGYILTSKKTGASFAVVDVEYLQKELFRQLPKQPGKLVIAVTHNTTFYADGDATVCCSWGTHGVDSATGNSFVLGSYLHDAPAVVEDADVQPLTQQLAEYVNDPLHDPLVHGRNVKAPGNTFPGWLRPASMRPGDQGGCGGTGVASTYFLLEPTNTNLKNNIPAIQALCRQARRGHLAPAERGACCPGIPARPKVSVARTVSPMRRRSPSLPSRARRAADAAAEPRRRPSQRSRQSP